MKKPASANAGSLGNYFSGTENFFRNNFKPKDVSTQQQRLRVHAIFRCLIAELRAERFEPDENNEFATQVIELPNLNHSRNFGGFNAEDLAARQICWIPNFILNALICDKLERRFGDLSVCNCFLKIGKFWRLDVDENLSRRGLFEPIRDRLTGLIWGLRVYRYPDDSRPFRLIVRGGQND